MLLRFNSLVSYFLPQYLQQNPTHPKYNELRVYVSSIMIGLPLTLLFPMFLYFMNRPVIGYLLNDAMLVVTLISIKYYGHYRIPMTTTAMVTYFIIYDWIKDAGLIYSSNVSILHIYLLAAIWTDKRYGWWAIFGNLIMFGLIYYQTVNAKIPAEVHQSLGGPLYALGMNCLITIFFGGFMAWQQYDQEKDRLMIRKLQDQKITVLDEAVKERTEQLNTVRERIATDFHDETGNMLSAITRQASSLKLKLRENYEAQPLVESIILNSNRLYASSKDFLWHLHHNSDDPQELFNYLTSYGQLYYNQFDIAFSSVAQPCHLKQLTPSAAINIIYIFKEAMNNVTKHSGAKEVLFEMTCQSEKIIYTLSDNGHWRPVDEAQQHYGLTNMERRCKRNQFEFLLTTETTGTRINVTVPAKCFD